MSTKPPNNNSEDEFEDLNKPEEPVPQAPIRLRRKIVDLPIWAKALIALILVFLTSIGYLRQSGQPTTPLLETAAELSAGDQQTMADRKPAPDIEVTTETGEKIKLSSLQGNVVVLNFWASWCEPCLVELPGFKHLHETLATKGLRILAVNVDENDPEIHARIKKIWTTAELPFPTVYDVSQKAAQKYRVERLPSNYILDRQGRIVASSDGYTDWTGGPVVEMLDALLAEKK